MTTNEERREAAKRKLEDRLEAERQQVRRRRMMTGSAVGAIVVAVLAVGAYFGWKAWDDSRRVECTYNDAADPFADIPTTMPDQVPEDQRAQTQKLLDAYNGARKLQRSAPKPDSRPFKEGTVGVTFDTSAGNLPVTLNRADGPCNVNGVISLAESGYYDNVPCHLMASNAKAGVLICGDPTGTAAFQGVTGGNPGWTMPDELPTHLKEAGGADPVDPAEQPVIYPRGTVAVFNANSPGNPMFGQEPVANSGAGVLYFFLKDTEVAPSFSVVGTVDEAGLAVLTETEKAGIAPSLVSPEVKEGEQLETGSPKNEIKIIRASVSE